MAPRGRKRKSVKKGREGLLTFATSSPEAHQSSSMSEEEEMLLRFKQIENDIRNEFNTLLNSIDDEILDLPFEPVMRSIFSKLDKDKCEETLGESKNKTNNTDGEFKHPFAVPKQQTNKKREQQSSNAIAGPSCSKNVHWEVESSDTSSSESDVFKTPKHKGTTSSNKSSNSHSTSHKEPYAVVTPGPMMNKKVKMMRIPQAGETAISLAGSPLLVTPFASNTDQAVTIAVADKAGKVFAIQPGNFSSSDDEDLESLLPDDAKMTIKNLVVFLSKLSEKL